MNQKKQRNILRMAIAFPAVIMAVGFASCSSCQKQEEAPQDYDSVRKEVILQKTEEQKTINRMGTVDYSDSISGGGHKYVYHITRTACDSLGVIADSEGYKTVDNAITLNVKRDGVPFFSRRYTRRAFKIGISDEEFSHYVLMNLVFDRITPNGPRFVVSVGEAETDDMFVQYAVTIGADGTTNVTRHEVFEENEIDRMEEKP